MASGPITSWQIDGEAMETVRDFIFLSSKITADGDCNHEIKRHLLLGRKPMSNLDSILKSRDITLTKVHLVKAVVFPVFMYGCESWTRKKAEHQRINASELWYWKRLLRAPWTARRTNLSILKEISPEYSLDWSSNTLVIWCKGLTHWKTLMLGKIEGRRRGWPRMRQMASPAQWTRVSASSSSWWWTRKPGVHGVAESDMTELLNWTDAHF